MSVYVRFERGRDDVWGPTLGPFEWVQQTYRSLRSSPNGDHIAEWHEKAGEWFIVAGKHEGEFYSDFIVFDASVYNPETDADDSHLHDCEAAKRTVGGDGETEERWDEQLGRFVPTGRVWNGKRGSWEEDRG